MTKAALLAAISAKVLWRGAETEDVSVGNNTGNVIRKYDMHVFMVDSSTGRGSAAVQSIYVFDEGGAGEAAYIAGNDRKSVPTFVRDLDTFLATKIDTSAGAGKTIRKITKDQVDPENEFAIVTAYIEDTSSGTKIVPARYFVAKDSGGAPYIALYEG